MTRDCDRFDVLLRDSIDELLPPALQAEFDAHLIACTDCVGRMKDYVVATQVATSARERDEDAYPALPEPLVARVLSAFRAERSGKGREAETG